MSGLRSLATFLALAGAVGVLAFGPVSCRPGDAAPEGAALVGAGAAAGPGQQSATVGGNASATGGRQGIAPGGRSGSPPVLVYPEDRLVRTDREVTYVDLGGNERKVRERLTADGLGNVTLELLEVWDDVQQAWVAPTSGQSSVYDQRQLYYVERRDLHLGLPFALQANYGWTEDPQRVTVAGRTCVRTTAHSRKGMGAVELLHEEATGLLLGWTLWNPDGSLYASLTTTAVDDAPPLGGIVWPTDPVVRAPWNDVSDPQALGFTPATPQYLPVGSYLEGRYRVTPVGGGTEMYLARYTDGLRAFSILEFTDPLATGGTTVLSGVPTVRLRQEVAEIEADAVLSGHYTFAAGVLPAEELQLVVAGLLP